ncbi:MAG: FtsX-like permease family protein [Chitinophagaceae bacterium]
MQLKLLINIAKSLLLARRKQSMVAAFGVMFGVGMFIAMLGFMTGLNDLLDGLMLNRTPHVRLYNEIKPNILQPVNESAKYKNAYNFISSLKPSSARMEIYNSGFIMESLKKDDRVMGYAPRITAQVFFNNGVIDINGIVNGIDVEEESRLFHFSDYVTQGKASDLKNISNSIILGKPLAEKMLVNIGDVVQVMTTEGDRYSLKVVGFFQSGVNDIDKVQSFASLATTQKILGRASNYVTDIEIKLKDMGIAPTVAREYEHLYGTDAEDIQTANAQFETGSKVRLIISYAVGIVLLVVAGFGIYNILNMMIYEKMDSIAILKATGFSGSDIKKVFLVISLTIGIAGGLLGLLLGFLVSSIIAQIPFTTTALPTVTRYPVDYNPSFYLIGIVFSLFTTYLAGLFPARKAGKTDPVIIIKGK